jgi:hypothetical protein
MSSALRQQAGALGDDAIAVVQAVADRDRVRIERLRMHTAQRQSVRLPTHPHRRLAGTDFHVSAACGSGGALDLVRRLHDHLERLADGDQRVRRLDAEQQGHGLLAQSAGRRRRTAAPARRRAGR